MAPNDNKAGPDEVDAARLEFAVILVNAPPVAVWTPKIVKGLAAQVREFFELRTRRRMRLSQRASETISREKLSELKDWAASEFEGFLSDGRIVVGLDARDVSEAPLVFEIVKSRSGEPGLGSMRGPLIAMWSLAIAFALASPVGARLRRCPDAKCGRYFVRSGRMEHCSQRCARRVYMRARRLAERTEKERIHAPRRRVTGKGKGR